MNKASTKRETRRPFVALLTSLIVLSGCANPMAAVKDDVTEFKMKHPDHLQKTKDSGIHYAWNGDPTRRPLIFVHGSPGSWEAWAHFLMDPSLRENFHLIAVDRPGYGESNSGVTERSLANQARLILEVMQVNKSGLPAILVGHSYGGPVIAKMAMTYPQQVAGVIFVAGSVDPDLESTKWYQYPADWWPIRALIPSMLKVCNQEIFALKAELIAMQPGWKTYSTKTVTIQGQEDDLVPPGNQDFLLKMINPKLMVEVVRVPGLNHFIPWKRPDLVMNGIKSMADAIKKENR